MQIQNWLKRSHCIKGNSISQYILSSQGFVGTNSKRSSEYPTLFATLTTMGVENGDEPTRHICFLAGSLGCDLQI